MVAGLFVRYLFSSLNSEAFKTSKKQQHLFLWNKFSVPKINFKSNS